MNLDALRTEKNLTLVNEGLVEIIRSSDFTDYVEERISDQRILSHLSNFTLCIVGDGTDRPGEANEIILQYPRFRYFIKSYDDLLEQFLHGTMHEIAFTLWKQCPVNYSDLTEQEADVFDDLWSQVYILKNIPEMHYRHPEYVKQCITFACGTFIDIPDILCLFNEPEICDIHNALMFAHRWLYLQEDVMDQTTFSTFMQMCKQSLKDPKVKMGIATYNDLLNGRNL